MASPSEASMRWRLLRQLLLPKLGCSNKQELTQISRRPHGHFGLITLERMNSCKAICKEEGWQEKELGTILVKYTLPASPVIELFLLQRKEDEARLSDFAYAKEHQIDMTGLVGLWPAEEVLTHFCVSNPSLFRNKRVLELGSGYGLGGLAIAACTEAAEVVLTDGNPEVIECIFWNGVYDLKYPLEAPNVFLSTRLCWYIHKEVQVIALRNICQVQITAQATGNHSNRNVKDTKWFKQSINKKQDAELPL